MHTQNTGQSSTAPKVQIPSAKEMLETGVQFGHQTKRWNPKMQKFIFAKKGEFHIIDISQTIPLLEKAAAFLSKSASEGDILFVATKRQAADIIEEQAKRCGAHYVTNRWVGGLFTNYKIVRKSINTLNEMEKQLQEGIENRTKQEVYWMRRELERLNRLYSGVKQMTSLPKAIVIVDSNYEKKTVHESRKAKIPIVAIVDTNCDPDTVDFPVPANDDALGSIELIMKVFADAVLAGNKGKGIKHKEIDLASIEIKTIKEKQPVLEDTSNQVEVNKQSVTKKQPEKDKPEKKETVVEKKKQTKSSQKVDPKVESILKKAKISIIEAKKMSDEDILNIKGVGPKTLKLIREEIK